MSLACMALMSFVASFGVTTSYSQRFLAKMLSNCFIVLLLLSSFSLVFSCNFFVSRPEDAYQEVLHSNKYGKTCIIYFPSSQSQRVNFTITFSQINNSSDSCSSSFIKVYTIENDSRNKKYHACSRKIDSNFSLVSEQDTVIMTLQTQFILKFQYEDMSQVSGSIFEKLKNDYRTKESCLQDQMVTCDSTRQCLFNETSMLCNATKFLCIKPEQKCNGVYDCPFNDESDELRCSFPMWRYLIIFISVVVSAGTFFFCSHNHYKSLKLRNMVRYQGDVIKRKDIVKIKKYMAE